MKDSIEIKVGPDGTIQMMYQEGVEKFAHDLGGEVSTSCRASDVEWEEIDGKKGWTVRSAYDRELAVRWKFKFDWEAGKVRFAPLDFCVSKESDKEIVVFPTREEALAVEVKHFWELLAPQREGKHVE